MIGVVKDERYFLTDDNIQEYKGKRRDGKKYWYAANKAKLQ